VTLWVVSRRRGQLYYTAWCMNWKGSGRKRHYPGVCLVGLRKTRKDLSQDRRCSGRESKRVPREWSLEIWFPTWGTRTPGGTRRHLRGYVKLKKDIISL
jgi:hypothetical protein